MHHYYERKLQAVNSWLRQNPESWLEPPGRYLTKEFDLVNHTVRERRELVSIIDRRHKHLPCAIVPPDILYSYHYICNQKKLDKLETHPVAHHSLSWFMQKSEDCFKKLDDGYNLVLIDKGEPFVALTTVRFRNEALVADQSGVVNFNVESMELLFTSSTPVPETGRPRYSEEAQTLTDVGVGIFSPIDIVNMNDKIEDEKRPMSPYNTRIMNQVFNILESAGCRTQEDYACVVSQIKIDSRNGKARRDVGFEIAQPPQGPGIVN